MAKIYSLDGKNYSFPDDITVEEVASIFEGMAPPPAPDQGFLESMGKGFLETALGASKAYGGATEETYKTAQQQSEEAAQQQGLAVGLGKAAPILGATVPAMAAIPAVVGGMGTLGAMGASTALAAPVMSGVQGGSRYSEVLDKTGGDEAAALKAGIASGIMAAGSVALPMSAGGRVLGASLLGRAGEGAAINMGTGVIDRLIQNQITGDYKNLHQDVLDPTSLALEGVMGGAFGAMSPAAIRARGPVPPSEVPPVSAPGTLQPPPIEKATAEQLTRLTSQQDQLTSYRSVLEDKLTKAEATVAKYPDKAYVLEKAQKDIQALDDQLASVKSDIDTVTKGGKEPVVVPEPNKVDELTVQLVEKTRRANEVSAKALNSTRPQEAVLLRREAETLIGERDALRTALTQAKKEAQEALAVAPEAPATAGEVPPYAPTATEAPSTLAEQGRASAVQVEGEPVRTSDINQAFDPNKVNTWSDEAIANSIAIKEAKHAEAQSGAVRDNIQSELNILYSEQQRRATSTQPKENDYAMQKQRQEATQKVESLTTQIATTEELLRGTLTANGRKPGRGPKRVEHDRLTQQLEELSAQRLVADAERVTTGKVDFSQETPQYKTPPTTVAGLRTAVETGGWKAGLNHIVASLPDTHILSTISKALLKNKWINPVVKYSDLGKKIGQYELGTENVTVSSTKAPDSATALVHEVIHRGSSNAIDQFQLDPSKLTSRERKAINQLTSLYNSVKDLPRVAGTAPVANLKEFLAYGLSHEGFASWLNSLKGVEKVSTLKKLVNSVMDLLGFDPKVRTAFTELQGIGEILVTSAREINPQADRATLTQQIQRGLGGQNISTVLKYTQDQLAQMVKAGQVSDIGKKSALVYKNIFGKLQLNDMFNNPVVNYVAEVVRRAEAAGVEFKHTLTYGINPEANRGVGKRFMSTKQYIETNSVYKTFHNLTSEMGAILHDWDSKFFGERVSVDQLKAEMKIASEAGETVGTMFEFHLNKRVKELQDAGVNPKVIDAYTSQQKAMNKAFEDTNNLLKQQGRNPVPFRADYHPAVRKGKFAVSVFANDLIYRVQLFRTEMEAKIFQDKMSAFPEYRTQLEDIEKTLEGSPNLTEYGDFAKDMFDRLGIDPEGFGLTNALDQMSTTGMKFGKHQEFRQGVGGYAGSEWFKTRTELGDAYKNSIFDWIDEQSSIRVKQDIKYNTERLLSDSAIQDMLPNATNIANHIRDMGMNNVPEWGWAKVFDTEVRNAGDGLVTNAAKLFGKKDFVAKVSPVDKTMGVMSTMFYMTTLMARPGFWVSQVLTAPSAIRHILKDTEIPLMDIITSFSKGSMRSFGAVPHDAVSAEVMRHLIDNTTTLRPQLQNELNTIKWMQADSGKKFAEVLRLISGQSPSEAADIISRVWTANMMIEHYRGKGLKGMELNDAVANATDLTMVAYNRSNKAAWVDKAGILGQAANPLLTYGTAQLGNLVSDIQFMAREKTLRSALPALSTMLVTQLMAGAIGLPILVEYQFLRDMLVSYDSDYEWMPDPKSILRESPAWLERGIPSAVTGFDVGSGMRWNPFLAKFFLEDNKSLIDTFPAIAFMGQVGKTVGMALADVTGLGKFTEAEKRKAYLAVTPFVGGKSLVDITTFDALNRDYVPGGRSYATVEQTPKEHLSTLLGTRTTERARIQDAEFQYKQEERKLAGQQQKLVDLVADQGQYSEQAINKLADMGLTGDEINNLLMDAYKARNTPITQRLLISGGAGPAGMRKKSRLIEGYGTSLGLNE